MSTISRLAAPTLLAALMAMPCIAAAEGVIDAIPAAKESGSARLLAFGLAQDGLPRGAEQASQMVLESVGYGRVAKDGKHAFRITPFLRYDSNLNGGVPFSSLSISGFTFTVDEAFQAAEGALAGLTAEGRYVKGLGNGLALEAQGGLSLGYAPEHDLHKHQAAGEACLRKRYTDALYVHGCVDASWESVDLGDNAKVGARAGVTRLFAAAGGLHEAIGEVRVNHTLGLDGRDSFDQAIGSVRLISAFEGKTVVVLAAALGAEVEKKMVMRRKVSVGVSRPVFGRPMSVEIGYQESSGGLFLGDIREDRDLSVSISRSITDKIGVTVSASRTRSNADPFDRKGIEAGVTWRF